MVLLALILPANAVDIDTFVPSGAPLSGGAGLQNVDARVVAPKTWSAGTVLGWSNQPLVSTFEDGTSLPVVSAQAFTRFGASWVFDARGTPVRIDADVPFYPWIGFEYANGGVPGYAMGDTRLSATVPVWGARGLTVSAVPALSLPTGSTKAWTGAGGVGAAVGGAVAWEPVAVPRLVVTGNLGVEAVPSGRLNDVDFGSGVRVAAGAAWSPLPTVDAWRVGAELDGRFSMLPGDGGGARHPTELHVYSGWAGATGPQVTLGVGTGLVGGLGTPSVRGVMALGWRARLQPRAPAAPPASECESLSEVQRARTPGCQNQPTPPVPSPAPSPTVPAPAAPPVEPDADRDTVPDARDSAPDLPEDLDGYLDGDGVPDPDNDADGVLDVHDLCPSASPAPGAPSVSGCPDPDADGFVLRLDACPDRAPRAEQFAPLSLGCSGGDVWAREAPSASGGSQIVLVVPGPIGFLADDSVDPASERVVLAIASWLQANPRAAAVEVAVHTDNAELPEASRTARTQRRADAVRARLLASAVNGAIDPARVVAKGYGHAEPLQTNGTQAGRDANRRVEIRITRVDGPRPGER
jgi:outer membrane protein OmpA-like peptidoglycan-associated protein